MLPINPFPIGMKIKRSSTWDWGSQDHYLGSPSWGIIIEPGVSLLPLRIRWKNGNTNSYYWSDVEPYISIVDMLKDIYGI